MAISEHRNKVYGLGLETETENVITNILNEIERDLNEIKDSLKPHVSLAEIKEVYDMVVYLNEKLC